MATKPDYDLFKKAVDGNFTVAQDALNGAKEAEALAEKAGDEATKQALRQLKEKFVSVSKQASTNATVTQSLGSSLIRRGGST